MDALAVPGEWIWSSILAHDPDEEAGFYQTLFGYEVFDLPSDDGLDRLILSTDDYAGASVNAFPNESSRRHPHWLDFVRVADTAGAAAKVVALGGRVVVEPHIDRHGDMAAIVADPAGALFGVMEWSDADSKKEPKWKRARRWRVNALGFLMLTVLYACLVSGEVYDPGVVYVPTAHTAAGGRAITWGRPARRASAGTAPPRVYRPAPQLRARFRRFLPIRTGT